MGGIAAGNTDFTQFSALLSRDHKNQRRMHSGGLRIGWSPISFDDKKLSSPFMSKEDVEKTIKHSINGSHMSH